MTPTTAADKVKEIIKSWDTYAYGPVWDEMEEETFNKWLATEEGSRLGERWVSVKDRTPDRINGEDYSENVLAIVKGHKFLYVMAYCFIECGEDSGWNWCNCNGDINGDPENDDDYNVTHWQPLPEPPKIN